MQVDERIIGRLLGWQGTALAKLLRRAQMPELLAARDRAQANSGYAKRCRRLQSEINRRERMEDK